MSDRRFKVIKLTPEQIEDWVAKYFDYKRRRNGDELLINNPFVPGDSGFKFNISTQLKTNKHKTQGYWVHDWRPSASAYNGSFLKFVMNFRGLNFREAIKEVCGDGIDLRHLRNQYRAKPQKEAETEFLIQLPPSAVPFGNNKYPKSQKMALNYIKSRGLTEKDAKAYKLHYTPTMIIFPYLEYDMIVYWQGRTFLRGIKQFEFPANSNKSNFIYGFDNAEPGQPVFITEAIHDSLTIGPGGLATGGASIIESQLKKIRAIGPSHVILAPDNDLEGFSSLYKNYNLLKSYYKVFFVLPPDPYKDWNQLACGDHNTDGIGTEATRKYVINNVKRMNIVNSIKFRKLANKLKKPSSRGLDLQGLN